MRVLKITQVTKDSGLSRSSVYSKMKDGTFPKPISLGARSVGWLDYEINEWIDSKKSARDSGGTELC